MNSSLFFLVMASLSTVLASNHILDVGIDFGAVPDNRSPEVLRYNTEALETAFESLKPYETLTILQHYHLYHGVNASGLKDVVVQIDGGLHFERDFSESWNGNSYHVSKHKLLPKPCLSLEHGHNITFTSSNHARGLIEGGGPQWWGVPYIGYLMRREHRPRLFQSHGTVGLVIENLIFQDAPFHSINLSSVNQVTIRRVSIVSRRTTEVGHNLVDLSAFNTDGIDISGHNVHVHDVDIWTQDDCIAVKDNYATDDIVSSNMTFERINASGLGFVIGSIAGTTVRNITFRDSYLYKSYKGIYLKFREPEAIWMQPGLIENILFENITIENPRQWAIWIGPAQQIGGGSRDPCHAAPCSLCWPSTPGAECNVVKHAKYRNITLKDVTIYDPLGTGVILGHEDNSIEDVVFHNVRIITKEPKVVIDPYVSFPGLRQPVEDPYVEQGYLIMATILGSSLLITVLCCRARSPRSSTGYVTCRRYEELSQEEYPVSTSEDDTRAQITKTVSQNKRCSQFKFLARRMVLLTAVLVLAITSGFLVGHRVSVVRKSSDATRYFVCSGVSNGVASGNTHPVPSCFKDHTTR